MPHFLRFLLLTGAAPTGCAAPGGPDVDAAGYGYPPTNLFEATIATNAAVENCVPSLHSE